MSISLHSFSPEQTFELGRKIGELLLGDEVLLLFGDLGAGKTLFTKGVASALGIDPSDVVSPTFTLMNQLDGRHTLYHFDLYRLGDNIRGWLPEIDDYLGKGVLVIEWAQFLDASYFNIKEARLIEFSGEDSEQRQICFKNLGDKTERILRDWHSSTNQQP